jgi:hypothetical protein
VRCGEIGTRFGTSRAVRGRRPEASDEDDHDDHVRP